MKTLVDDMSYITRTIFWPSYVQGITNVMASMEEPISHSTLVILEQILVYVIKKFPFLPKQRQPNAWQAFLSFCIIFKEKGDKYIFKDVAKFLTNVLYQGILQTCSHPVITENDEDVLIEDFVISVTSYFQFWLPNHLDLKQFEN